MGDLEYDPQRSSANGSFRRPATAKRQRRFFPMNIAKIHWCYTIEDVCMLYNVHSNTIYNWIADGLRPIDDLKPRVFRGAELNRFHKERRESKRHKLKPGELLCTSCKRPRYPRPCSIRLTPSCIGAACVQARCSACDGPLFRNLGSAELAFWMRQVTHNSTSDSGHE
jgi:hypothetical protein